MLMEQDSALGTLSKSVPREAYIQAQSLQETISNLINE